MENLYPTTIENLSRIEWNGQPVLTTSQLAEKFECAERNLRDNFTRNADRFIEGKHYFKLDGDEFKNFKDWNAESGIVGLRTPTLHLWTKRGAARHSKLLGTDVAWEVFELLEDTYFNQPVEKIPVISDFERGKELAKLAPFMKDSFTQSKLIAKAANLLLGYEFLEIPTKAQQITLFY